MLGIAFILIGAFLTLFLPFMAMYATEIRMYTWTMLFVTLTAIYAYRIVKEYLIILILGIYNNVIIVKETYKPVNGTEVEYVKSQYQDNTIILYKDIYHATNIFVQMPEYNWCLYDIDEKHDLQTI